MFDAIHTGPSPYSVAERRAWRAEPYRGETWHARLETQRVLIAEDGDGPIGFLSLAPGGYVDLGYILPRARGCGVFRRLHERVETEARRIGETRLHTHASLSAEGPFAAMGYHVTERETVMLNGEQLRRAAMEKTL